MDGAYDEQRILYGVCKKSSGFVLATERKQIELMTMNRYYAPEGFPERLREVWLASGMTQNEVSKRIGYERKSISKWMSGDYAPNTLALARLCRLFHVSADYLLFGEEKADGE